MFAHTGKKKPRAWPAALAIGLVSLSIWGTVWGFGERLGGVKLTDDELNQYRGGYSGFYFGVSFTGYWNSLGQMSGTLVSNGGIIIQDPNFQLPPGAQPGGSISGDGVSIQSYVGNFNGASGIFQIIQSPGSFNVIQNNLVVQITLVNVANQGALSNLRNLLN
ncbi:MAG: hypothetical protein WHX93_13895 [bacterium]